MGRRCWWNTAPATRRRRSSCCATLGVPCLCADRRRGAAARADACAAAPSGGRICWCAPCRPTSWMWWRCRPRCRRCRGSVSFPDRRSAISIRSRRGASCKRARGALGRSVMVPGGRRSAQGSGDPAAGLRRCAGRHRGVQSQSAGAAESRGRRRFRSGRLRPSRRLERRRKPDRDAPGQPARATGARRRPGDPLRARRDDPHREQLQVCAGAIRRAGRGGRMAQRGAVDRSGAACSHCICWSRGEDRNGPPVACDDSRELLSLTLAMQ